MIAGVLAFVQSSCVLAVELFSTRLCAPTLIEKSPWKWSKMRTFRTTPCVTFGGKVWLYP